MTNTKLSSLYKKITVTMAAALMMCGFGTLSANAATTTVGDFTIDRSYNYGSYSVTVKSYSGAGGDIELPQTAEINGTTYQIEGIGSAFKANTKITSVTIPEGYTSIDANAFSDCVNLTSVNIPGSMTSISANAFENCTSLSSVNFADDTASSLSILNSAFANCTALTSLELPARLNCKSYSFVLGCTNLSSITVKEGSQTSAAVDNVLYNISGDSATLLAYAHGKPDTEFTIPSDVSGKPVTAIAMHVFRNNGILEKITVPASVTSINGYAFNGMTAIKEIAILSETAPSLSSYAFTDMASGSKIIVQNEAVAAAFEPQSYYTYYTPENTTVTIAGSETETVSAVLSIEAQPALSDGNAVYNIYFDEAANVNTVLLKIAFDASLVEKGAFSSANDAFDVSSSEWTEENSNLILTAYLGTTGNKTGYTTSDKANLASVSVPVKVGINGSITAEITKAECAGVTDVEGHATAGTAAISTGSAALFIASYDVNNDGTVDIIDITEAQRYYQASSADDNWSVSKSMDVNGDNKVDIEDFIAIFNNLSDF